MAITITDPALMAEIEAAQGITEFRDPSGRLLSVVTTDLDGPIPDWVEAKIKTLTAEELAERRKTGPGRSLKEIHADIVHSISDRLAVIRARG